MDIIAAIFVVAATLFYVAVCCAEKEMDDLIKEIRSSDTGAEKEDVS